MKKYLLPYLLILGFFSIMILDTCKKPIAAKPPIDGLVAGYVYTDVNLSGEDKARKVFLPDVEVTIIDGSGIVVAKDTTDIDGSYRTKQIKKGNYKLKLSKVGFHSSSYEVTVQQATNHPGPLKLPIENKNYLYGTVTLLDGNPAWYKNDVFNVFFFTTVKHIETGYSVRCNTSGEYIIPNIKTKENTLIASCQKAPAAKNAISNGSPQNFVFKNTKPFIQSIVAFDSLGKSLGRTIPGTKLDVVANVKDREGQTLDYIWRPTGDFPGSTFNNSNTGSWKMTGIKSLNQLSVLVLDNFGGVDFKTYTIEANDAKIAFTGTVKNMLDNGPIANGLVLLNGKEVARINANGYFSIRVDEVKNNRYVLNVEKPGYMLHSSIYQKEAFNQNIKLVKATEKEFDPNADIVIREEEDKFTQFTNEDIVDNKPKRRSRIPALVKIKSGSIVDANGQKVNSQVIVQLRTIDLYNEQGLMPGDYCALENGVDKTLISFGAVDVQIRDKVNPEIRYNLAKNKNASVEIPISSDLISEAPATIKLWDYDETNGIWMETGSMTKSGNKYSGLTPSFSSINTDVAITGGTCLFLQDNPNNPIFPGSDCDVTITVPTGGAPRIKHAVITQADQTLTIARLPLNTDITITVSRGGAVIASRIIKTATSSSGPASAIDPINPASICSVDFYKKDPPVGDVPSANTFLNVVNTAILAEALAYYKASGAITDRNGDGNFELSEGETLAEWKIRNGFDTGDDAKASYFNAGDLAFYRAMHQKTTGSHIAYYVSNYNNALNADNNVFGGPLVTPLATVAMEYEPGH
jgi:hypothetical protein